ncbi:TPA: SDR family NAD(P)-dependent oxidoreductase [Pseudomonas aeruginosa]
MNDETSFNPFSLSGRRILVTGASSGLGLAIAQSCARMGAELIVSGRDPQRLGASLEGCRRFPICRTRRSRSISRSPSSVPPWSRRSMAKSMG